MTEQAVDHMDTIPEDGTSPVDDPKSADGILARLSEIERRLHEKADNDLRKKVAHMEVSFKGISKDVLKHQEAMIPIVEAEIARLTTDMEQGLVRIRTEVVQITDQVANCAASSIERLLQDIAKISKRVDKLENLQPAASLKLDGASVHPLDVKVTSKDRTVGKDVIDNASTASGSAGSQQVLIRTLQDNAGATRLSSGMSDDGISTNSSEATIIEAKLDTEPSLQEKLAPVRDEKAMSRCSVPEKGHQDLAVKLKNLAAAVEHQVTVADWLSKSTGSVTSWATSNRMQIAGSSSPQASSRISCSPPASSRISCSPPASSRISCSPPASSRIDRTEKSMQSTLRDNPLRFATREPLTVIPPSPPARGQLGGSCRLPVTGVDPPASLKAAGDGPGRTRALSVDQRVQRTRASSVDQRMQRMPKSFLTTSGSSSPKPGLRGDTIMGFSSTPRLMPQQMVVYEKTPLRSPSQV